MPVTLDTTQELIEKSLYEVLRSLCVDQGLTPDIFAYPNTDQGYADYQAALASIQQSKGFAIEIFNQGNNEDRGYKKHARIVLITDSFVKGEYGMSIEPVYTVDTTSPLDPKPVIITTETQNTTHEMYLNCYIIAENTSAMRTLFAIINQALPLKGFIPYYNDYSKAFFIENMDMINIPSMEGVQEKLFKYRIPDISWTSATQVTSTQLAELKYIHLNFKIAEELGIDVWIPEDIPN